METSSGLSLLDSIRARAAPYLYLEIFDSVELLLCRRRHS